MSYFFSAIASLFIWNSGPNKGSHPAHKASPTEHGVDLPTWDANGRSVLVHFAIPSLLEDVDKRNGIRQTWIKDIDALGYGKHASYKFYIGKSKYSPENQKIQEENIQNDIEVVDEIDEWRGKVYKVIEAMGHVTNKYPARYLVVVEDETFVNVPALMALLSERDTEHKQNDVMYAGRFTQTYVIRDKNSRYYVSEHDYPRSLYDQYAESVGYVVSRPVCAAFYAVRHLWKTLPIDDVNFGHWLSELKSKQQFGMEKCEYVKLNDQIKEDSHPKIIFSTCARTPQHMLARHRLYQTFWNQHPDMVHSMFGDFKHKLEP